MTRPALLESLRGAAVHDVEAVRAEARAQLASRREELASARAAEQTRLDREIAAEVGRIEARAAADAERRSRETRAAAESAMAERLLTLAREELPCLCGKSRERLFDALVGELPAGHWQRVRVNPADAELAGRCFADAAIETDPAISGGLETSSEDGRITVSNTLETRLAAAWPDLLPGLLAELAARDHSHGSAA